MQLSSVKHRLKVIGLLSAMALTTGCDQSFPLIEVLPEIDDGTGDGGVGGGGNNGGGNQGADNIVTAFQVSLFSDLVTEGCTGCHTATPPIITNDQAQSTLANLLEYTPNDTNFTEVFSFQNTNNTLLVTLIRGNHFCGAVCDQRADILNQGIQDFAANAEPRFSNNVTIEQDIQAFAANVLPIFQNAATCAGAACHDAPGSATRPPLSSADATEAYLSLQGQDQFGLIEVSARTLVPFVNGHFGRNQADADAIDAAMDAWLLALGQNVPAK